MKCLNCESITTNPKFCSRSCAATYTNKLSPKRKLTRICSKENCCNVVKNYRSVLCEEHFIGSMKDQKEKILNTTLGEYRSRIKNSNKNYHMSSLNVNIRVLARSWHKHLTKLPCNHCGYSKHVELCHIKAISSFSDDHTIREVNHKDNIIQLCPNCHWELDNKNGEDGQTRTDIDPLRFYSLEGNSDTSPLS